MAIIKVKWVVDELTNVMTQFDTQKVYWSTTETGSYTEATDAGTRVDLAAGQTLYYFDHLTGDPDYWYKVSYFHSTNLTESDLSPAFQASQAGGYATIQEVRDAGITVAQADDAAVAASIDMWSKFMDQACRQWFEPRTLDIYLDGNDARVLWFWVPIIGIDELYMNGDFTAVVDTDYYEVYNNLGSGVRDDRKDPKIALADLGTRSLYEALLRKDIFEYGHKNQHVKGSFGFVEADGSTPPLINRAVLKLIKRQLGATDSLLPSPTPGGPVIGETTDGHSIRYGTVYGGRSKIGTIGITGDPEVEAIIQLYRSPKAMAVVA